MTFIEEERFIAYLTSTIKSNPKLLNRAITALTYGIELRIREERERSIDMESIAMAFSSMVNPKYSAKNEIWAQKLIATKLEKWKSDNAFMWNEELQEAKDIITAQKKD